MTLNVIQKKMIERHPHVFEVVKSGKDGTTISKEEVNKQWEEIKAEKRGGGSVLDGVTEGLSSLLVAEKYGRRASEVGFDWEATSEVLDKIEEEIKELKHAKEVGNLAEIEEEIGDLLFSVVNLSRFLGVNAELALRGANRKFSDRFRQVEEIVKAGGMSMKDMSIDELEQLWRVAKGGRDI